PTFTADTLQQPPACFFSTTPHPPPSPPFPYTTLFRSRKSACAAGSSRLVKSRSIASPPYWPGGRLIECTTSSVTGSPVTLLVVQDRKSTRLNSSHGSISYAVFCLKKKRCQRTDAIAAV